MQPPPVDQARSLLALDTKVVLFGLCTAALTAAGTFFQKLNGVRVGNPFLSGWLFLAAICFFPTFIITNKVFLMGGRMSLFVPATAAAYVFSMLVGRYYFGEEVSYNRWFGCALIVVGVGVVARG
jgi:drug/metabolite transporter (DMT)-like permease